MRVGWNGGSHHSLTSIRAEARRAADRAAYRAVLDREGVGGPEDILVAGNDSQVRERIAAFADAGATDLRAAPLWATAEETERTRALLAGLVRGERD